MRICSPLSIRSHRPFEGRGASLYAGVAPLPYRKARIAAGTFLAGPESTIGGSNVQKTGRVATVDDETEEFEYTLPAGLASSSVLFQVRTFRDDVENETDFRPAQVDLDVSLDDATTIHGTARLLAVEPLAGGVVRIRFAWDAALTGIQPLTFTAIRTAGPTSPANAAIDADSDPLTRTYEIETPALQDGSPYTYKIRAANGSIQVDVLTGIAVQADATGPSAPTSGSSAPF